MKSHVLVAFATLTLASRVGVTLSAGQSSFKQATWDFDNLARIGGLPVKVEGAPKLVSSPVGKAIEFDGVRDSLFIERHPLAGAETFTFEAIFRPDGGAEAQRWFHLAQRDSETGMYVRLGAADSTGRQADSNPRLLFELRVVNGNSWYLDAFTTGRALMFPEKLYPVGRWYHVAQVYDGKMYRSYVNGELQGEAPVDYRAQGDGAASIGARVNKVDYFRGAVAKARFTFAALPPTEFMRMPMP
jgi:hypothetical protein